MMEVDDTESTADGGGGGGGELRPDVSCSICLKVVTDNGERSWANLKCGHQFHLDCIGSAFNAKEAMQCPNCRKIEDGQWLFASGCHPPPPETNVDDLNNDQVDIYDTEIGDPYSEPYWWLPSSASQSHQDSLSSEEPENPSLEFIDFLGEHTMTEISSSTLPGPFIEQIGPLHSQDSESGGNQPACHWFATPSELTDGVPTFASSTLQIQAPLFSWSNYRSLDGQDHSPSNVHWRSFLNSEMPRCDVFADLLLGAGGGQSRVAGYRNSALRSIPGLTQRIQGPVYQDPSNTLSLLRSQSPQESNEQGLLDIFRARLGGSSQANVASSSTAARVPTVNPYSQFLADRHGEWDSPMPDYGSLYHPSSRNPYNQFVASRHSRQGSPIRDRNFNHAADQQEIMPSSEISRHASGPGRRSRGHNRPGRSSNGLSQSQLDLHL